MATNVLPSRIVLEVIKNDYADWRDCITNYFLAHDLWDIVETTAEPPEPENDEAEFKAWTKKNAAAVHAILISCGRDVLSQIKDFTSAKTIWHRLAIMYDRIERERMHEAKRVLAAGPSSITAGTFRRRTNQTGGFSEYATLYEAVRSGDGHTAYIFLASHPDSVNAEITHLGQTALHVAVVAQQEHIVQTLVEQMLPEGLQIQDNEGLTALAETAIRGSLRMARCMISKNKHLVTIGNNWGLNIPLVLALRFERRQMALFLYSHTPLEELVPEKGSNGATVVTKAINTGNFDIALDLIMRCPRLSISLDTDNISPMSLLAGMSYVFPSGDRQPFWTRCIYSCIRIHRSTVNINYEEARLDIENNGEETTGPSQLKWDCYGIVKGLKHLYEMKLIHLQSETLLFHMLEAIATELNDQVGAVGSGVAQAIFSAIRAGIFEFVFLVVRRNPELLWVRDSDRRNIFMSAVQHRREKIFSLMYGLDQQMIKTITSARDNFGNNILHLAGNLTDFTPLDHITGAALQMQRELQWFKEVESLCNPMYKTELNKDGLTPKLVFTKTHKDLMKDGEIWMKGTAGSCTVVGALIVTIMFAAAFTVPGGTNQETGFPVFIHKKLFETFIIADSLSLFSSSTSVLMFLGILTSRYAEEDFIKSLPNKMIIGLSTLFFSIATMMISFSATLLIMLREQLWMVIPIICLAGIPVSLFAMMQFNLLVDMIASTYGSGTFNRKMKPWLTSI
ncbi:hypothetical protein F2P56_032082 [Juglans regia]|uniref:Uncharacterized protein LOC108982417 n=2 Tax=Juglans regia TaxID=51240 RepID=A0A2I4DQC4_JUGRE|nr:uncharacterized protein LOC108982417 [Juglans regia]XP_035540905.1 uncharacterized protein LOC108982417 [Juglans regia]KAF5446454.1 hypothetical protein F2P56_032082 [Juglans regia]